MSKEIRTELMRTSQELANREQCAIYLVPDTSGLNDFLIIPEGQTTRVHKMRAAAIILPDPKTSDDSSIEDENRELKRQLECERSDNRMLLERIEREQLFNREFSEEVQDLRIKLLELRKFLNNEGEQVEFHGTWMCFDDDDFDAAMNDSEIPNPGED